MPPEQKLPPGKLQLTLMIKPNGTLTTRSNMEMKDLIAELEGSLPRNGYAVIPIVPNEGHNSETLRVWRQDIVSFIIVEMGEVQQSGHIIVPKLVEPTDAATRRS